MQEHIEREYGQTAEAPPPDLARRAKDADIVSKRLTGRTPERIAEETGIPRERIFPAEGAILYVGDPWQRMGREIDEKRLTIIDYEFGETASFVTDNEDFRRYGHAAGEMLLDSIAKWQKDEETMSEDERSWLERFEALVETAHALSDTAAYPQHPSAAAEWEGYKKAKEAWSMVRTFIEETHRQEREQGGRTGGDPGDSNGGNAISWFRREAWYRSVEAERGFGDIPDWHVAVLPRIEAKRQELAAAGMNAGMINEELQRFTKMWIDEIRLTKKPERANVLEAIFPELPFREASFDRFVASWSISAHAFDEMDAKDFAECWREIHRVLKPGGEAFIFPIRADMLDRSVFVETLERTEEMLDWKCYDGYGHETGDVDKATTLWLRKR